MVSDEKNFYRRLLKISTVLYASDVLLLDASSFSNKVIS